MNQIKAEAARYAASHDVDGNAPPAAEGGGKKKNKDNDNKDKGNRIRIKRKLRKNGAQGEQAGSRQVQA